MFWSFSIDSMLSSRDVFTGFLARFFQELWLIKYLPAAVMAGVGVKGIYSWSRRFGLVA